MRNKSLTHAELNHPPHSTHSQAQTSKDLSTARSLGFGVAGIPVAMAWHLMAAAPEWQELWCCLRTFQLMPVPGFALHVTFL